MCQAAKASANTKRWREKHPNITEYRRAHEFIDTYARRAYQREYQKRDRQANPEKYAAKQKSWRVRHGLELRIYENNRRCKRLYDADGTLTVEDYRLQEERQGSKCNACGAHNTLEIDHVRPLCQGGSNWPDNVQLLCHACNKRKSLKEHG